MTPGKVEAWLAVEAKARIVAAEAELNRCRPLAMEALRMRSAVAESDRDSYKKTLQEVVEWAQTLIDLAPMIKVPDGPAKYSDMVTKGSEYILALCSIRGIDSEEPG